MKNIFGKLMRLASHKPFKKGFTLTELLVVVLLLGVLAAVALPAYTKSVRKSRASDALSNLNIVSMKQQDYMLNNEKYATSFTELNAPVSGLIGGDGEAAVSGDFTYTLDEACINATRPSEYTFVKNGETQKAVCINEGSEDLCKLFKDLVPTGTAKSVDCEYTPGGDDGGGDMEPPVNPPCDCGGCTKDCGNGVTITGICNTTACVCEYAESCPMNSCNSGDEQTVNGCVNVCTNGAWVYARPADGHRYDEATKTCVPNLCPEGTVQKNTVNGVHYCRTYTMGKWVPEGWTQVCK